MGENNEKKGSRGIKAAFLICLTIFLVSAGMLTYNYVTAKQDAKQFDELANLVEQNQSDNADGQQSMLQQYKILYDKNSDLFGWLKIDGTPINYPVMFTPDDPEYYLRKAFDKTDSSGGTPFIGEGYTDGALNFYVYGHHMKNGSMFAGLLKFSDKAFWQEHPTFFFDTLYEEREYQIVSAFQSKVYSVDDTNVFRYYDYAYIQNEAQYNEYVNGCKSAALYQTDVEVKWPEELITLSTCGYHTKNGRFVILAKRIS